jgi:hypothetical protein
MLHRALRAYLLAAQTEVDASTYLKEKEDVSITKQTSKNTECVHYKPCDMCMW